MKIGYMWRKILGNNPTRSTFTQTYATATTTVPAATAVTLTGTLTGTVNGALVDVADIALSTSNTYTDAAVNTAVNTAVAATNEQIKELMTMVNKLTADSLANRKLVNGLVDALQSAGIAL